MTNPSIDRLVAEDWLSIHTENEQSLNIVRVALFKH